MLVKKISCCRNTSGRRRTKSAFPENFPRECPALINRFDRLLINPIQGEAGASGKVRRIYFFYILLILCLLCLLHGASHPGPRRGRAGARQAYVGRGMIRASLFSCVSEILTYYLSSANPGKKKNVPSRAPLSLCEGAYTLHASFLIPLVSGKVIGVKQV